MFSAIMLIIGGLFACYGLIIAQAPSIKDEFDKIIPIQGAIGLILFIMGLVDLILIVKIIKLFQANTLFGMLALLALAAKIVLGIVLSYGVLTKYVLTSDSDVKEKTESMYNTLIMVQVPFGILAILLGLIALVLTIIY